MLPFLEWIPVVASLSLGLLYLFVEEGRPVLKLLLVAVFGAAVYLQFFSRHSLSGLLLQITLALALAVWQKVQAAA